MNGSLRETSCKSKMICFKACVFFATILMLAEKHTEENLNWISEGRKRWKKPETETDKEGIKSKK
jgi:hypothetical protein